MSSPSLPASSRRKQPPEETLPVVPEPKQGSIGNVLAILSVMAVLGFGLWTAFATLTAPDKPATKPSATAGPTLAATKAPAAPAAATTPAPATAAPATTPTGAAATTPTGGRVHVVGEGDNLYRIAQRYGTTVEAIMAANGFTDKSKILHVGDRLTIP